MAYRKKGGVRKARGQHSAILGLMAELAQHPITLDELVERLGLPSDEREGVQHLLAEMESRGELVKIKGNKYGLRQMMNLVVGRVQGHADGYAFVIPDSPPPPAGEDVFINPRNLGEAMHGDRVVARIEASHRQRRREGRIIRVLERGHTTLVGRYEASRHGGYVTPAERRITHDLYIPKRDSARARTGQVVVAAISRYPTPNRNPEGRILEILGEADDPAMEVEVVIHKFGLPRQFPAEVLAEVEAIPAEIGPGSNQGEEDRRLDLRHHPIVTIDGEDAKDFDDAVSVEPLPGDRIRLGVHIADVSHYVRPGTALDLEARDRGTSIYLLNRVIPMLPPRLSEGLCSLKPGEDRLTISVFMDFDRQGKLLRSEIADSIINSRVRLTYTEVASLLQGNDPTLASRCAPPLPDLHLMGELAQRLREARMQQGSIDFDLPEADVILDAAGHTERIVRRERTVAHRLIEEFMLAANQVVASYLTAPGRPCLYRIHEEPDRATLADFNAFIHHFGYHLLSSGPPTPKSLQRLLLQAKGSPEERLINQVLLRSMKRARYSATNQGHFGLAFDCYTHFTSPIRRYPDLVVHRLLRQAQRGRLRQQWEELLPAIAQHSSERERVADEAERELLHLKRVQFMQDKVDEEFWGFITGVTTFGMFVELEEWFVEGLIHVSSLLDDYYSFDEKRHSLVGRRTRRTFRIGDRIRVRVENVSVEKRQIDFRLIEKAGSGPGLPPQGLPRYRRK